MGEVTDQLSLSIWLNRSARVNRLRHFEKMLRLFPFSQRELQPQTVISIHAIDMTEPPLLERSVNGPLDIDEVASTFPEHQGDDIGYEIESWWDLWVFDGDWALQPVAVSLSCFGPEFDNGTERGANEQEDLRVDFGVDAHYLPQPDILGSARLVESNVKSLLRLVHEIESLLPVTKRLLETESGANFAERLQQALAVANPVQ